jgi:hypothetical protein
MGLTAINYSNLLEQPTIQTGEEDLMGNDVWGSVDKELLRRKENDAGS